MRRDCARPGGMLCLATIFIGCCFGACNPDAAAPLLVARAIWRFIEANVPESTHHRYHLIDYQDWFLPCVTDWLIQSKASAMEMVMLSVAKVRACGCGYVDMWV